MRPHWRPAIRIGREQFWVYAALDADSKLLVGVRVSRWRAACPASAFLSELKERHNLSETEFLVDGMGYLTALAQTNLGGHLDYVTRNLIEKWFQTLKMRLLCFHSTWRGQSQRWALVRRIRILLQLPATASSAR